MPQRDGRHASLLFTGAGFADHNDLINVIPGQHGFNTGFRIQKRFTVIEAIFFLKGKITCWQFSFHRAQRGQKNTPCHPFILLLFDREKAAVCFPESALRCRSAGAGLYRIKDRKQISAMIPDQIPISTVSGSSGSSDCLHESGFPSCPVFQPV